MVVQRSKPKKLYSIYNRCYDILESYSYYLGDIIAEEQEVENCVILIIDDFNKIQELKSPIIYNKKRTKKLIKIISSCQQITDFYSKVPDLLRIFGINKN